MDYAPTKVKYKEFVSDQNSSRFLNKAPRFQKSTFLIDGLVLTLTRWAVLQQAESAKAGSELYLVETTSDL